MTRCRLLQAPRGSTIASRSARRAVRTTRTVCYSIPSLTSPSCPSNAALLLKGGCATPGPHQGPSNPLIALLSRREALTRSKLRPDALGIQELDREPPKRRRALLRLCL